MIFHRIRYGAVLLQLGEEKADGRGTNGLSEVVFAQMWIAKGNAHNIKVRSADTSESLEDINMGQS